MAGPTLASAASGGSGPQAFDLTTVANLKASLFAGQATPPTTDDALLQRMISSISAFMQAWAGYNVQLGRMIGQANYTEELDAVDDGMGWPAQTLYKILINYPPIQSVTSVTIDGFAIPSGGDAVAKAGYFFDPVAADAILVNGYWPMARGKKTVIVTYSGGYPAIPYDLEQACIEAVSLRYRSLKPERDGVRSVGMAGATTSYIVSDLSPAAKAALQPYKRLPVP
jgi:hypothetical protein